MARIKGVSPAQAGLQMKIAYHFTRRSIAKLTGRSIAKLTGRQRETERMIEPLEIYALVPVLFKGYAKHVTWKPWAGPALPSPGGYAPSPGPAHAHGND